MVDTPKESDGDEATEDNPLEKQSKHRRRRRSKSCHSKNSDNSAKNNNTPVDSKGNDDPMDPAMEQDEPGDGEHSPGPLSDHSDGGDKTHKPAFIIPEKHLEQEDLRKRLIATARSLKKQKQRLKAAQDTFNRRWNKVLDPEEKYGGDCHTKSYPKRKLLPEFDDEVIKPIPPKNNTADRPDRPPRDRDKAASNAAHKSAHDLREHLVKKPVWPGPSMDLESVL